MTDLGIRHRHSSGCILIQQRSVKKSQRSPTQSSHCAHIRAQASLPPVRRSRATPRGPGGIRCAEEFSHGAIEGDYLLFKTLCAFQPLSLCTEQGGTHAKPMRPSRSWLSGAFAPVMSHGQKCQFTH